MTGHKAPTALFTVTIFLGAALLFVVQPMFARMALPLLGGVPAVWTTAMVFFQAALLAGYAYAHGSMGMLRTRPQLMVHFSLLVVAFLTLPIVIPANSAAVITHPVLWLLQTMTLTVGLSFLAVSATSPMVQRWSIAPVSDRPRDPYFLYAASNAGSLLALLSYPLLIEPNVSLEHQAQAWRWLFAALIILMALCARSLPPQNVANVSTRPQPLRTPISNRQRIRWVALAAVPSSLLMGVTTYLSSDIAALPLLWVVPLAMYLLTFVVAFSSRSLFPPNVLERLTPLAALLLVLVMNLQASTPLLLLMVLHLAAFFVLALRCHTTLAVERPEPGRLTEFYLWLSVGGMLGGVFNAIVAPVVFESVLEYPIAIVAAVLLVKPRSERVRVSDLTLPLVLGVMTTAAVVFIESNRPISGAAVIAGVFGLAGLCCFFLSGRTVRFAFSLVATLVAAGFYLGEKGSVLYAERSFFGIHRVTVDKEGVFRQLVHGTTLHGSQFIDPARANIPLSYYHPDGPAGDIMRAHGQSPGDHVGAIGLGAGSLASYARPGQTWRFFEIDPVVEQLARDERYFTFLRDAAVPVKVVLGDARLSLVEQPDSSFDLLVLDAYSSDAIPVHLITREALALYQRKLAPGGVLAFHISNLHLDLESVLANLARDAGIFSLMRDDTFMPADELVQGRTASIWLVMARKPQNLASFATDQRWRQPVGATRQRVWTDDYSSLFSVFQWR